MPTATSQSLAALAFAHLNILTKKRYDFLLSEFGSLENALRKIDRALLQKMHCKEETIARVLKEQSSLNVEEIQKMLDTKGISFLTFENDAYPELLRNIADPPVFLFGKGDLSLLSVPSIALVGTRDMSPYGKRVVEAIVPDLVRANMVTVSGLALGIDAEVARKTMQSNGKHIAVLGHGLGAIYPRTHTHLAKEIVDKGGLLLSEYPPHVTPDIYTFPARNRIIAGLSLGTVVLEAALQSGSLITASLALEYGREIFAIPGQIFDPHFTGTHELIAKGCAKLIQNATDILRELGVVLPKETAGVQYHAQTPDEKILLGCLHSLPQSGDDLMEKSGLPIATIHATLTLMELKGGAKNIGAGMWVKT